MTGGFDARKAIVLAAGVGSRLRPLTDLRPKPLVEVGGTPILFNALRNLNAVGVKEVTIVVGYRKDAIQCACGRNFNGLAVDYVESTRFDMSGSAYSLWLARDSLLAGDCYVLEADVFFEEAALRRLQEHTADNVTAVVTFIPPMEGSAVSLDMEGSIAEYRLRQIATETSTDGPPLFKTMNLSRFSCPMSTGTLISALDRQVQTGRIDVYLEQILSRLTAEKAMRIAPVFCDDIKWFEIDTPEDLQHAETIFANPFAHAPSSEPKC
ncbi:NDP-sugar pyrophosphorylase family protein [Rhizobium sp. BK313]|uniref:phosphocholine cytidylyltransferase family protein n=1 Tax=Rhizobium sp. BK313 TaxID=2587081 RepID=UPI00105EA569|nr:phosphocholine cytidylyltransferase family protein [Rhizobium sp. BK313]MBB3458815.1 NDP-sugar pyrophosphorylase family protein [Rhizobium sp. BK313]